jgi:hypothetical protein
MLPLCEIIKTAESATLRSLAQHVLRLEEQVSCNTLTKDQLILRRLVACNHGCPPGLYTDDGEMNCPHCKTDFLRASVSEIEAAVMHNGAKRLLDTKSGDIWKIENGIAYRVATNRVATNRVATNSASPSMPLIPLVEAYELIRRGVWVRCD